MNVGYARTSTTDQKAGLDAQMRDLEAARCEKIFCEQVSSMARRAKLQECLQFLREGDSFMVCKPDRLARSLQELLNIADDLSQRGVGLMIQSMGLDTRNGSNPTAKLMLSVIGAIAQFERELMLERQREGIAKAKAEGRYKGRPPSIDAAEIRRMKGEGVGPAMIAKRVRVARSSVYRLLKG